jgi:hypothetical protein
MTDSDKHSSLSSTEFFMAEKVLWSEKRSGQEKLTEGKDLVPLTSSLSKIALYGNYLTFSILKSC